MFFGFVGKSIRMLHDAKVIFFRKVGKLVIENHHLDHSCFSLNFRFVNIDFFS